MAKEPAEGQFQRMELRPPDLYEDEERELSVDERRDWFAEALGDAWETDGDGIYRYVPEPDSNPRSRPVPDPALLTWTLDCGHEVPVLPDERPDVPPPRPRMCLKCGELRTVTIEP